MRIIRLLANLVPASAQSGHLMKFAVKNPKSTHSAKGLIAGCNLFISKAIATNSAIKPKPGADLVNLISGSTLPTLQLLNR